MHKPELAVFGGGCFWCTEAVFQRLKGVISVMPGYSGGNAPNPTYEQVSAGTTGHIESIKIDFNPGQISFTDLLNVFFATHNPTTKDRQGADAGPQYRSAVFYTDTKQKTEAENYIKELESEKVFSAPIVTELKPFEKFYQAEDYHQNYYNNNENLPYCRAVINPKIAKLRAKFAPLLKNDR